MERLFAAEVIEQANFSERNDLSGDQSDLTELRFLLAGAIVNNEAGTIPERRTALKQHYTNSLDGDETRGQEMMEEDHRAITSAIDNFREPEFAKSVKEKNESLKLVDRDSDEPDFVGRS